MAGRPTIFDRVIVDEIIKRVSNGETLKGICRSDEKFPDESTFRSWVLADRDGISTLYARAREQQAEAWADVIVLEAEDSSKDTMTLTRRDGTEYDAPAQEWIARSRLRVDTYKWLMAKLRPKVYGDKIQTEHSGEVAVTSIGFKGPRGPNAP